MYLKRFSYENNKAQIGVYNIKSGFYKKDCKLKTQACKPFYYGKDGAIEDSLSNVENGAAPIISGIVEFNQLPIYNSLEHQKLLFYTLLTELRNPTTSKKIITGQHQIVTRLREDDDLENAFEIMDLEYVIPMALRGIKTGMEFCIDLHFKLFVNKTTTPFITGDNPVVKYNQLLDEKNYPFSGVGYGNIGFELFFPLSPDKLIVFYDSSVYRIGDKKQRVIELNEEKDVNQFNLLQVLNCDNTLFFNEALSKEYLDNLSLQAQKFTKPDSIASLTDNNLSFHIGIAQAKINLSISCIGLTKNAKQSSFDGTNVQLRPRALALSKVKFNKRLVYNLNQNE
jgi:hypothetical protein